MEKPPYYAPLLAIADHTQLQGELEEQLDALSQQPLFRQYQTEGEREASARQYLASATSAANRLTDATGTEPAAELLRWAGSSLLNGARALLAGLGIKASTDTQLLRETGRLVVKNALPRALSFYAAGGYGDFSVHRLPLAGYQPGLHIAAEQITAQASVARALRQTRKRRAITERVQVQDNPNTAIRNRQTGKPLDKWKAEHWQLITWRLGYTTFYDVVTRVGQEAAADPCQTPAPAALLAALRWLTRYHCAVVGAYLGSPELVEVADYSNCGQL